MFVWIKIAAAGINFQSEHDKGNRYMEVIFQIFLAFLHAVQKCDAPDIPTNAKIHRGKQPFYQYGDRVYVSCVPGYYRRGSGLHVCELGGWVKRGGSKTVCLRKYIRQANVEDQMWCYSYTAFTMMLYGTVEKDLGEEYLKVSPLLAAIFCLIVYYCIF